MTIEALQQCFIAAVVTPAPTPQTNTAPTRGLSFLFHNGREDTRGGLFNHVISSDNIISSYHLTMKTFIFPENK